MDKNCSSVLIKIYGFNSHSDDAIAFNLKTCNSTN